MVNLLNTFVSNVNFSQPHIHYWLEKLMQSKDVINITDKPYMQNHQACIKQNQEKTVKKRIHDREVNFIFVNSYFCPEFYYFQKNFL